MSEAWHTVVTVVTVRDVTVYKSDVVMTSSSASAVSIPPHSVMAVWIENVVLSGR